VATDAAMNAPIKMGMRNSRGASGKKVNEAVMSALPVDESKRAPPYLWPALGRAEAPLKRLSPRLYQAP
jgi:hypothetical protein